MWFSIQNKPQRELKKYCVTSNNRKVFISNRKNFRLAVTHAILMQSNDLFSFNFTLNKRNLFLPRFYPAFRQSSRYCVSIFDLINRNFNWSSSDFSFLEARPCAKRIMLKEIPYLCRIFQVSPRLVSLFSSHPLGVVLFSHLYLVFFFSAYGTLFFPRSFLRF